MELNYLILCEDVIIDNMKRASIINIFDNINAAQFPIVASRLKVVFNLTPGKEAKVGVDVNIIITNKGGKELAKAQSVEEALQEPNKMFGGVVDFSGLVIEESGEYFINLIVNKKTIGRKTLSVNVSK